MIDVLYEWPVAARFGARIPKERFYERTANSSAIREKFIAEVQRINWAYKLAEETINLLALPEVPEIEVLQLDAKASDIGGLVLASIDKAIPNPVIFEIHRDDADGRAVRMAAAYKPVGSGSPRPSAYFSTGWMRADSRRVPMPTAITMPALYSALVTPLTPIAARPGERASELAGRLDAIRKLEHKISFLERKLRSEPQLNRKMELRRELQTKQSDLEHQR